jgi:hypothetical protein
MRLEQPKNVERFGAVRFGDLQKVFELDSSGSEEFAPTANQPIRAISHRDLYKIQRDMAIVIPVRSERLKLIEGVLCGVPHPCLIIVVSNSPLKPVDRFSMEVDALNDFCQFVGKNALIVHQKDAALADAFRNAGYTSILDSNGVVHDGKAEGMLIATVLAQLAGKKYIGFVDADNYFPGAVEEYIREYAAGFTIANSRYSMVRIAWHSKPKIVESIEPYHLVNILERFGGFTQSSDMPEIMKEKVEVYQIESRNPHLHEAGDDTHIDAMRYLAMQVIYHSPICPDPLKREIRRDAARRGYVRAGVTELDKPRYFPALSSIDTEAFLKDISSRPYGRLLADGAAGGRWRASGVA